MEDYRYQIFEDEVPQEVHYWCSKTYNKPTQPWSPKPIEQLEGHNRWQVLPDDDWDPNAWKVTRIAELQHFLNSTDWYCSRYVDIGTPIPDDIKQQRSEARIEIDRLRHELEPVANEPTTEPQSDEPITTDSPTDQQ